MNGLTLSLSYYFGNKKVCRHRGTVQTIVILEAILAQSKYNLEIKNVMGAIDPLH